MELGWEEIPGNNAGNFTDEIHRKIVLHRTQGSSIDGAVGAYRANNSWPHCTVDFSNGRRVQHNPLSLASRALRNESGGVETNRDGVVNVEIVGFSSEGPNEGFTPEECDWLKKNVIDPIRVVVPVGNAWPEDWTWQVGSKGYGTGASQRMSKSTWDNFSGICAHAHVPENSHWDVGFVSSENLRILQSGVLVPTLGEGVNEKEFSDWMDYLYQLFFGRGPDPGGYYWWFTVYFSDPKPATAIGIVAEFHTTAMG